MCVGDEPPAVAYKTPFCLLPAVTSSTATAADGQLVVEKIPLTFDGYTYPHSTICYVKGRQPTPVVLVHPNYAGLKQFDIDQASFLARCGYVGFALDLYKETPEYTYKDRNPSGIRRIDMKTEEEKLEARKTRHSVGAWNEMNRMLSSPVHWRGLMAAYLDRARQHPAVHRTFAGAIGYCFGGQCLLEQVRAGHELQAVCSFHGLLQSYPVKWDLLPAERVRMSPEEFAKQVEQAPNNYAQNCKVLIENGDLDHEVPKEAIAAWKEEMDGKKIDWRFNNHAQTPHGFALAPGVWSTAYTEAADRRSTLSMLSLFAEVWPDFAQYPVECNACGTQLGQWIQTQANLSKL